MHWVANELQSLCAMHFMQACESIVLPICAPTVDSICPTMNELIPGMLPRLQRKSEPASARLTSPPSMPVTLVLVAAMLVSSVVPSTVNVIDEATFIVGEPVRVVSIETT